MGVWLTTTNYEQPVIGCLNVLKVQGEGLIRTHLQLVQRLRVHIISQDKFGIAFQEPNFLQGIPLIMATNLKFVFLTHIHRHVCHGCLGLHFHFRDRRSRAAFAAVLVGLVLNVFDGEF